ncbi:hypothetical protein QUF58_03670 [Anaerolineales bacterium HSG24]|nr:hypothetical protein [Anaerolineales bacterium HSG24]
MNSSDKTAAYSAIFEIIGGYCGMLGLGWIYAGDLWFGLLLLVVYALAIGTGIFLIKLSLGCLAPCLIPLALAAPIISAIMVHRTVDGGVY